MQTKYILKVVYWILFISLVIVAIFFVHDVWQNYQEGATSIQITSKITKLLESPTITLCFNPGFKISNGNCESIDSTYRTRANKWRFRSVTSSLHYCVAGSSNTVPGLQSPYVRDL